MERNEQDPVRLAVSDEPMPEGAEQDPEVRAALADVETLREQLAFIATAVAGTAPAPEASAHPLVGSRPRRRRALRRALVAVAAVAVLGTGAAYLVAHNGELGEEEGTAKPTAESLVACATDIAEGKVTRVERLGGDQGVRVTLSVERTYKPAGTAATPPAGTPLVFTAAESADPYFREGARMLVVVSRFAGEGPVTFREGDPPPGDSGEDVGKVDDGLEYGRKWVEKALPGSVGIDCSDPG
ncbi:hypothetical protein OG357_25945 [Streptomyces sp. NBC_01255]|uniref:hypothetical protein n=1 Tax=Streptomyces sp. NBC_01255 TaxID=2903798 RepID=UPI002E33FBD7|nr:hypothetical protein [Streptomyces sp. NBC_01255]